MTGVLAIGDASSERAPAPGPLGLVQAFVNTEDIDADVDRLSTPAELASWLEEQGLEGGPATNARDLTRVLTLRAALREALAANAHAHGPGEAGAAALLTLAGRDVPLRVAGSATGPVLKAAGTGIDAALGRILAAAVTAVADGTWPRLKVCRNDACRWAYWDTSRNRSGIWCTMAICGNRAKGRAFRQRGRSTPG